MKKFAIFIVLVSFLCIVGTDVHAQCAMCKMSAEAGTKAGNTQGLGVNPAILYLAAFPYLIISTIAYLFWKNYKRKQREEKELAP